MEEQHPGVKEEIKYHWLGAKQVKKKNFRGCTIPIKCINGRVALHKKGWSAAIIRKAFFGNLMLVSFN
jgi:ribosomal protein L15E